MKNNKIMQELLREDPIIFLNGFNHDRIHPGQILAQYIESNIESKAYQEFNLLLNECLTLASCSSLLLINDFNRFNIYYPLLKETYKEAIILKEFESLVELIELQLKELVLGLNNEMKIFTKQIIDQVICSDETLALFVDQEKAFVLIKDSLINEYNLRYKTAKELSKIDFYEKSQMEWIIQISNLLIENITTISK